MNSSGSRECPPSADDSFGPVVDAACRHGFDFTLAFEQSILVLLPAALLLLAAPFRLLRLRNAPVKVAGRRLRDMKLAAVAILTTLHVVLVVLWATRPLLTNRVSIAAACVSLASSLMTFLLSHAEHARSPRPSSLLNGFLLLSLILDAALLRTLWLLPATATPIPSVFAAATALKAALVVLEGWDKSAYLVAGVGPYAPEATAGLYARAVFSWVTPLLRNGFRSLLTSADLFRLDEDMGAAMLVERFWRNWNRYIDEKKAPKPVNRDMSSTTPKTRRSLIRCCILTLGRPLLAVIPPRLALLAFTICQPLALNRFLVFLDSSSQPDSIGYGLVAAYGFVYLGIALAQALYWHRNGRCVTMLRGVLVSAVFAKATEMSVVPGDDSAAVTLMSSDVNVIVRAAREMHEFWANSIQIAVATWLLASQIGYAAAGPVIVSAVALAGTLGVAPLAKKYQVSWLKETQKRVGITSAMVGHIKSIKMSGLASTLSSTVTRLRASEVRASRPFRVVGSVTSSIAQVPLLLSPVVAFAMFQGASGPEEKLDATRLFSALSLVFLLAQPLFWMFEVVLDVSAALGALERIEAFLEMGTRREYRVTYSGSAVSTEGVELQTFGASQLAIDVRNAAFAWSENQTVLQDVTLPVKRGHLALLVGPVASGKSTLLQGLLGEVPNTTGLVRLGSERLSWCDQSPWLLNKSIRENIIGYSPLDETLYNTVVQACDLQRDFEHLSDGDDTVIGSKGIVLSGGQKQRVSLARAVYSRPEIALFDDVFSGLDNHTAQRVFRNLFHRNGLLRRWGTTVVLATQSASFLPSADQIIALGPNGRVSERASFKILSTAGGYTQSLLRDVDSSPPSSSSSSSSSSSADQDDIQPVPNPPAAPSDKPLPPQESDKRRQLGDGTVYHYYFGSIGYPFLGTLLVLEVVWAFLQSFPAVWLNFWADANARETSPPTGYYLGVYALLQIAGVFWFALLIWFVLVLVAARSGIALHQRLLETVIKAPLSLFTSTDLGSITTRFSQDIGMVDNNLPLGLVVTLASFFSVLAKSALLASSTPYVAASFPPLLLLYHLLQRGYLRTSRQLRLLDLEAKAPVYAQFLEVLSGLATLRSLGWCAPAREENHKLVDASQRPFYLLLVVQRWLVLVLDLVTAALALLVAGFAVLLRGRRRGVDVGLTGVALVQLIGLSETLNMLMQFWTAVETSIGAVARIKQFSEEVGDENLPGEDREPPKGWPARGEVVISHLTASYGGKESVKALDDVSLHVRAGEKIGICGRTGSGKSSLLLTMLALPPPTSGTVTIDALPLSSLPRSVLRARLVAVTQDQFLLPGSVRQNLDPSAVHTTSDLYEALELVGLQDAVEALGGVDAPFGEDALSHGQRQLFFLARAVLRGGRGGGGGVVLLDEATSSVDAKTEEVVKEIIETRFKQHTVISVAHRLDTIVDFDRVVVMERGAIVETGKPKELLATTSKFKALWDANRASS